MQTIGFDIGGVLWNSLPNHCANCAATAALYKTLLTSSEWRVGIITGREKGDTPENVLRDLDLHGLPAPHFLEITYPGESKGPACRRHGVEIFIDDILQNLEDFRRFADIPVIPLWAMHPQPSEIATITRRILERQE